MQPPPEFHISSVLKRTGFVLGRNFPKVAGVSGIAALPGLLLPGLNPSPTLAGLPGSAPVFGALFFLSIIFAQGVVLYIAFQAMRGTQVSLIDALKIGFRQFLLLFATVFCMAFVLAGLQDSVAALLPITSSDLAGLSFVVPAVAIVLLFPVWSLAIPASVVEGLGPLRSFGRSRALTRGHRFKMMVLLFVAVLAIMALRTAVVASGGVILKLGPAYILALLVIVSSLVLNAIWLSFSSVLLAVAYHDLRLAKDGSIDPIAIVFD